MPVESDNELREILGGDTIAVVGCSSTPGKAAHGVPKFMKEHGYTVHPVNPYADEIFGEEPYDSLADVPDGVDIVDVFRPGGEAPGIVDETLERDDVGTVWLQLGIRNEEAANRAEAAGLRFVQDRCLKVEYERLMT